MNIIKYQDNLEQVWDEFVSEKSFNGTIYHTRQFLNYHPKDRFVDTSILIYHKNILTCVFPCCQLEDGTFFSHRGATYGGPVLLKCKIEPLTEIINLIFSHYQGKLKMRIANDIYFKDSQSNLIYLLNNKLKLGLELSFYIDEFSQSNIRNKHNLRFFKRLKNNDQFNIIITDDQDKYIEFYKILEHTLKERHNTKPTHTLKEFLSLKDILGNRQKLCIAMMDNIILSGMFFLEATPKKFHTFYISQNYQCENSNQMSSSLICILEHFYHHTDCDLIDLGITTQHGGHEINMGLAKFQEESLTGTSSYRYFFS